MASRRWDAYRTLNITSRDSNGMTCVGNNRYGNRCRWDTDHNNYMSIRAILDELETKPPMQATRWFPTLAQLSLCDEFHQGQAYEKISEWNAAAQETASLLQSSSGLGEENRLLRQHLEQERTIRLTMERDFRRQHEFGMNQLTEQSTQQLRVQAEESLERYRSLDASHTASQAHASQVIAELNTKLDEECRTSASYRQSIAELRAVTNDYASLEIKAAELAGQVDTQDNRLKARALYIKKLRTQQQVQHAQIEDLNAKLNLGQNANDDLASELITSERLLRIESEARSTIQAQLQESAQLVDVLRSSLQEADLARDMLFESENQLRSRFHTEVQKTSELEKELEHVRDSYKASAQTTELLEVSLSSERRNTFQLADELRTTKLTLASCQDELKDTQLDLTSNKKALTALQDALAKSLNDEVLLQREAARRELELSEELNMTKRTVSDSREELRQAHEELISTKNSLDSVQDDLAKALKALENLRRERVEKETGLDAQIYALRQEVLYFKSHIFRSFVRGLFDKFERWTGSLVGWFGNLNMRRGQRGEEVQDTPLVPHPAMC